ncbi:hypothetical protein Tco_1083926 [Tanacetum coccineum]
MVINPPWNLPFLGAKGFTNPEQMATVEMVFSQPWTCTFLVAKGLTTPELMANWRRLPRQRHSKTQFGWQESRQAEHPQGNLKPQVKEDHGSSWPAADLI